MAGSRVVWVATPPGERRPRRRVRPRRYTGPPSYPALPRWGFPPVAWRWPLALPSTTDADPEQRLALLRARAVPLLRITSGVAAVAACAELWRYVILVISRNQSVSGIALAASDVLVTLAGVLTWLLGVACVVVAVLWVLRARTVAAKKIGVRLARPDWQVIAGVLVPLVNFFVPGSVLAELEHMALIQVDARRRGARPTPSRLVQAWWGVWAANLVLGWLALIWGYRQGVQAMADDVLLHAWNDAAVAALAVISLLVVQYLTGLLTPVDPAAVQRLHVLSIREETRPAKAPRPPHSPR